MSLYDDFLELARRLETAGWQLAYDAPVRPPELKRHDRAAIRKVEKLLGYPLPPFMSSFALDVGAVFLGGHAAEGSAIAGVVPSATTPEGAAALGMLTTVPLPVAIEELAWRLEDDDEPAGLPVVEDAEQAAGLSGGPPLCVLCGATAMDLSLFVDVDPDEPLGVDLETYLRRSLAQGGMFHLPEAPAAAALFLELGAGLGTR